MPIACRSDKDKATVQVYLPSNLKDENGWAHVRTNVKQINVEMTLGQGKNIVEQIDSYIWWMQIGDIYGNGDK